MFEYQYLLESEVKVLRYRWTSPDEVDRLLASATGCVFGSIHGRPYLEIIVDTIPHRLAFDADTELTDVVSRARALGVPIHRAIEMVAVLVATCALAATAVATAIWLRL